MPHFAAHLTSEAVTSGVPFASKKALFAHFGAAAAAAYGLDAGQVIERVTERERLGSTGFGKGVAIPHGKIESLDRIVALFVRAEPGIEYEAVDDLPVDLIFCLLSPPDAGAAHLKALAEVSRALRDPNFVAKLRGAGSTDALCALLGVEEDARHAA
jgi:nitrogen PTS system EIIA component